MTTPRTYSPTNVVACNIPGDPSHKKQVGRGRKPAATRSSSQEPGLLGEIGGHIHDAVPVDIVGSGHRVDSFARVDFGRLSKNHAMTFIYPATTRRYQRSGPARTPLCWTQPRKDAGAAQPLGLRAPSLGHSIQVPPPPHPPIGFRLTQGMRASAPHSRYRNGRCGPPSRQDQYRVSARQPESRMWASSRRVWAVCRPSGTSANVSATFRSSSAARAAPPSERAQTSARRWSR